MSTHAKRILVIDDDIDFREYVVDVLLSRGFNVLKAINGREGVDLLKTEKVDLLLTDMIMPEREGVETIMEVRLAHPDIKIIAMSGAMRRETYLQLADGLGADATIVKPFRKQELFDSIEQVFKE